MSTSNLFVLTAVLLLFVYAIVRAQSQKKFSEGGRRLPGPKGLPFIGSVLDLPELSYLKFHEWAKTYGPIFQVSLLGETHVVVTSPAIAKDLLLKRSANYWQRPPMPALEHERPHDEQYIVIASTEQQWQRQRKFSKHIMDVSKRAAYYGYPELESIRLLQELIENPKDYEQVMEAFVSRVTSRLAWGTASPHKEIKQRAIEMFTAAGPTSPGNLMPFVMSLPEALSPPKAKEYRRRRTENKFLRDMRDRVAKTITSGSSTTSWMRQFLENQEKWGFTSDVEGATEIGSHTTAGAFNMAAAMQSFCLAMCYYPQYQPLLQEEIDRICGEDVPTSDRIAEMPVLRALVRETMRWRPVVPTGIPNRAAEDDVYNGYLIPKDAIIHAPEWSMGRDCEMYP